jgi:formamidopyrimidine-DNA glycosylase
MPELPEVETIRRQLAPRVAGRTIVDAQVLDPLWCAPRAPEEVEADLRGEPIVALGRRGKYLLLELADERFLVMHLRMTGNLLWVDPADDLEPRPHLRVRLVLDDDHRLLFTDQRRFGTGLVIDGREALDAYIDERLGPEPLDPSFTPDVLRRLAAGRRAPVKAFLLDQRRVAGVGNIYADEALFRARIHPLKPAGRLKRGEIERLHAAIVETLEAGIAKQGSSIDDYLDSNGERGSMQDEFQIHLREGLPCVRCGRPVVKLRAAGRGTYVCRRCQPVPRPRRVASRA